MSTANKYASSRLTDATPAFGSSRRHGMKYGSSGPDSRR
nr:MAG TPA: hypothetical protein [Caudoviricetes sp.]